MKKQGMLMNFIMKEWLLMASCVGFVLISLVTKHFPSYSSQEIQVLFILFVLFIAINGLQKNGLILKIAQKIEKGQNIPLKLVVTTFFLSMVVSNDVALIVIVPLTLSLNISHKDILVILEALAANSGSALTPIGNPQNLFIYWFYDVQPQVFIKTIAPFSLIFLGLLIVASLFVKVRNDLKESQNQKINKKSYIYGLLLFVVLLTVFHILPVFAGIVVILYALLFDRKTLHIDYSLLFTFFFFFGIANNLQEVLATELSHSRHIFLFSALASQIMSNVPATLLFAKFTSNWQALLWGANAGGFGSLVGSLANLIAFRIYITHKGSVNVARFTVMFLAIGYTAFLVSIALYFVL